MADELALVARPEDAHAPRDLARPAAAGGDEGEGTPGLRERRADGLHRLGVDVTEDRGLEDDRRPLLEHAGQRLADVALDELRRVRAHDLDRPRQTLEPLVLARPDEALEKAGAPVRRDVDRPEIDTHTAPDARDDVEQPRRHRRALVAGQPQR